MKGDQSKPIIYRNGFKKDKTSCYTIKDKIQGVRRAAIIYVPDEAFDMETGDEDEVKARTGFKTGKGIDTGPKKVGKKGLFG